MQGRGVKRAAAKLQGGNKELWKGTHQQLHLMKFVVQRSLLERKRYHYHIPLPHTRLAPQIGATRLPQSFCTSTFFIYRGKDKCEVHLNQAHTVRRKFASCSVMKMDFAIFTQGGSNLQAVWIKTCSTFNRTSSHINSLSYSATDKEAIVYFPHPHNLGGKEVGIYDRWHLHVLGDTGRVHMGIYISF